MCLGFCFTSCVQKEISFVKAKSPSSDWEVMELIKSAKFDDTLAEFGKCIQKSSHTKSFSQEKCETIIKKFSDLCQSGSNKHCVLQAEFYLKGSAQHNKAIVILTKSCDSGYGSACVSLGESFVQMAKMDTKKGMNYWHRACELGSAVGCGNLADIYHKGIGIQPNIHKAKMYANAELRISDRDCKAGQKVACEWLEQAFSTLKPLLHIK